MDKDELVALFREKFSLGDKEMPRGDALYLVSKPIFTHVEQARCLSSRQCDEDFRDVTFEMEDADDLYNGAVIEWRMPERKKRTQELSTGVGRRATASGKLAMRTPGVMAAIAAKKDEDAKKATEKMEKEAAEAAQVTFRLEFQRGESPRVANSLCLFGN